MRDEKPELLNRSAKLLWRLLRLAPFHAAAFVVAIVATAVVLPLAAVGLVLACVGLPSKALRRLFRLNGAC